MVLGCGVEDSAILINRQMMASKVADFAPWVRALYEVDLLQSLCLAANC